MKNNLQNNIKAIILGIIVAIGVSYAAAGTFTGPTCPPPNCNADAPLNVGTTAQGKQGGLVISPTASGVTSGLLTVPSLAMLAVDGIINANGAQLNGGLILRDGSQGTGKVLVSDSIGNASWKDPSLVNYSCSVSASGNLATLTGNSGNNTIYLKLVAILDPGTYTFTGSGTSNDSGGGGINSVFLSSTYYNDGVQASIPTEVSSYNGTTNTSQPDVVTYGSGSPIVYAVKRFGNSATTNWSIPTNTTATIASTKYMYVVLNQAAATGNIYASGTKTNCTNGVSAPSGWVDILTTAQKSSSSFPNDQYYYVDPTNPGTRSPMQICTDAGYTSYAGACRGNGVSTPFQYEGTVSSNTLNGGGGRSISCNYGSGSSGWHADKNTQILCVK